MWERYEGLNYIYAEYCPGDFFWGWWLYAAPIISTPEHKGQSEKEMPDREHAVWLHYDWRLDALFEALKLSPRGYNSDYPNYGKYDQAKYTRDFLCQYPIGVLCQVEDNGRRVKVVRSDKLWDFSRKVRELQLLDWKESGVKAK